MLNYLISTPTKYPRLLANVFMLHSVHLTISLITSQTLLEIFSSLVQGQKIANKLYLLSLFYCHLAISIKVYTQKNICILY